MELIKEIQDKLEEHDWHVSSVDKQNGEYYAEIGKGTPAGEDWWETIWFDGTKNGFAEAVMEAYNDFDVDEAVEIWIEGRGKNGVPSSIRTLVEDAEWKEKALMELGDALVNEVYSVDEEGVAAWKD